MREWTGLEFDKSQKAVENRRKWRKLVAKSSVVPQRPSRLRDRWDEMRERVHVYISYKDYVTNEEARPKIPQAIGPHEDLLTIVKRCKLQWYGHVSR